MFKAILCVAGLVFGLNASAHIEEGVWEGKTADGTVCSMTAGAASFENNTPHPLNERIKITVDGNDYVVHHPAGLDRAKGTVDFNHDFFQGWVATSNGARGLEIEMVHTEAYEGPRSFWTTEDNWRTDKQVVTRCLDIKHKN